MVPKVVVFYSSEKLEKFDFFCWLYPLDVSMESVGDINQIGTQNDTDYVSIAHKSHGKCYSFVKKNQRNWRNLTLSNLNHLVLVVTIESIDGETTSAFSSGQEDSIHANMKAHSFVAPKEANSALTSDGIEGKFA